MRDELVHHQLHWPLLAVYEQLVFPIGRGDSELELTSHHSDPRQPLNIYYNNGGRRTMRRVSWKEEKHNDEVNRRNILRACSGALDFV